MSSTAIPYTGDRLFTWAIVMMVLLLAVVGARLLARRRLTKTPLGWDDYIIVLALVTNLGNCATAIVGAKAGDAGYHLDYVEMVNPGAVVTFLKAQFALEMFYWFSVALPRISILLFYRRIFPTKQFKIATSLVGFAVVGTLIGCFFASIFQCTPIEYIWDKTIQGKCIDQAAFARWCSLPNVLADAVIFFLPLPVIWRLQISRAQKIGLVVAFGIGGLGIVASCIRMNEFFHKNAFGDATWNATSLQTWTIVEGGAITIAACLPSLRPFLTYLSREKLPKLKSSTISSKFQFRNHPSITTEGDRMELAGFEQLDKRSEIHSEISKNSGNFVVEEERV